MAANLEAASGMPVEEWVGLVERLGPGGFMARVEWLKQEHGLGHFQARLVAEAARDGAPG